MNDDDPIVASWSPRLRARDVFLLGAISVLLFLWTHHPAVGAVVPLLLSGRRCWNVGWWLYDRDPNRRRARTVLMFYVAWAVWKAAASAFGTVFVVVILSEQGWFKIPEERMAWTLSLMAIGLVWNVCWCVMAILAAHQQRLKVWLSPHVVKQCRGDFSQLARIGPNPAWSNRAVFVIASGVGLPLLVFLMALIFLPLIAVVDSARMDEATAKLLATVVSVVMIGIPALVTSVFVHAFSAHSPNECWRDS